MSCKWQQFKVNPRPSAQYFHKQQNDVGGRVEVVEAQIQEVVGSKQAEVAWGGG